LPLSPREVYSFGISQPPVQIDWDIDAARALIEARPRIPQRLDPPWLELWLAERTSVTAEHLDHIPGAKLDEPAIIVEVVGGPPGQASQLFRLLIDGTHGAARKLRNGQECWAYLLTEQEQRSICTYRLQGRITEMPTFPWYGSERPRRRYRPAAVSNAHRRCLSSK